LVHIDSTSFGEVVVDGKKYCDVLIVGDKLIPRKRGLLERMFGTSHAISMEEVQQLLSNLPEVVIIGTGQSGVLKVQEEHRKLLSLKAQLIELDTPQAVDEYNRLSKDKRVNILIHTTC
jgi:hypothetical protein